MTVVDTTSDPDTLTLTIVADLAAPPAQVWTVWADPRRLERWWGPPTWPATFPEHDLTVGSTSRYTMTGPDGQQSHGWWRVTAVDEPRALEFEDGFADASGRPAGSMPVMRVRVDLAATPGGTRMTVRSRFSSDEDMQKMLTMGMAEGMSLAMGQIDDVLLTAV